jgi:hypothetical protein
MRSKNIREKVKLQCHRSEQQKQANVLQAVLSVKSFSWDVPIASGTDINWECIEMSLFYSLSAF